MSVAFCDWLWQTEGRPARIPVGPDAAVMIRHASAPETSIINYLLIMKIFKKKLKTKQNFPLPPQFDPIFSLTNHLVIQ